VFEAFTSKPFDPNNNTLAQGIVQGLESIITLGFLCVNQSSNAGCVQSRRKRDICPNYIVNTIPPIILVSKNREFFI
jgi:hypothetical protein